MTWALSPASIVWSCVLAGMASFFLLISRRVTGRGYEYLGLAIGAVAAAGLGTTAFMASGPGLVALLAARMALLVGLFAVPFNLHFLYRYCGYSDGRRLMWVSYVSVLAAALANLMSTAVQARTVDSLTYPEAYQSPSLAYSGYAVFVVAAHFVASSLVLFRAYREGRRVLALFLVFVLLAPATLADITGSIFFSSKWFVAEAGTWLYCLIIIATLLVDIQGAEGLLKETTSSLAARTRELESSYAEIDLMYNELSQKQQMAAVGELAAAIAHEVRNPLAIIMNAVSGMRRATITPTDRETLLSIVNEESERLNHLVTELLRFARPVAASRGPASLLDICNRAAKEPPEGYTIVVSTPEDENLEPVLVDPGLFRLALDNLVANSAQAMESGGTIEFQVRRGEFADGTPAASVDIVDTGCGMRAEELESAKKPFFTTKPRGTGLGIPIADRIVEAHGGEMEISSAPKRGTTVTIRLPFEEELKRTTVYPGAKHPSTRRRMRSIPPSGSMDPTPTSRSSMDEEDA